jgi:FtsP/CotA-like multicopper oxidase with cupredoxin domain
LEHPSAPAADASTVETETRLRRLEDDLRSYRLSRDTWTLLALGLAFVVVIGSIVAIGLAQRDDGGSSGAAAVPPVTASLTEYAITLSSNQIPTGGSISFTNDGTLEHNLGIRDTELLTPTVAAGASGSLDLSSLAPGTYTLYCQIAGHASSGMETEIVITDAPAADAAAMGMTAAEHAAMTPQQGAVLDQNMIDSIDAFLNPVETLGTGNQVLEPVIVERADGEVVKRFELTASIVDFEVSPGTIVQAWAYNGQVPGPRIDVEVGDHLEVEIHNELPLGTDIHWHGIDVPNSMDGVGGLTQDIVASGESFTYEFTTTEAATGMYHAHAHGEQAVPNGLFGTMYVGQMPLPAGRTISGIEVPEDVSMSLDIPMVLNDAGVIGLSLNGKSFPATEKYVMTEGDWAQITYFNEGVQVHPMHLHGFEQIVIAKDGEPLDQPYAADTILVGPGERYTVIFHADQPGAWVWHCHILNHAESADGLFGMVTAVVVNPAEA